MSPMTLTVYSRPECSPCKTATALLAREGITYIDINVEEDHEALERLKRNGITSAPAFGYGGHIVPLPGLRDIIKDIKEHTK